MGIDRNAAASIWRASAEVLGWRYSPAHAGWISDAHVDHGQYGEGGHASDMAAEDACFLDGVETIEQAVASLREAA